MTTGGHELSTFALDVHWASGLPADLAIERHLLACARCRAYLASLDASLGGEAAGTATPTLAPASPPARPWGRALRFVPVAATLAAAAAVVLVVRGRTPEARGYVGVKGAPAVQLLLHRGSDTRVWDGVEAIHPGDAIALRVACEGLERVAVAAPDREGWSPLSSAACPAAGDPLPFTLVVDAEPHAERLAVVMSQGALDDADLRRAIADGEHSKDVWVVDFVLPKDTETER
jgi:hypothetical protein